VLERLKQSLHRRTWNWVALILILVSLLMVASTMLSIETTARLLRVVWKPAGGRLSHWFKKAANQQTSKQASKAGSKQGGSVATARPRHPSGAPARSQAGGGALPASDPKPSIRHLGTSGWRW